MIAALRPYPQVLSCSLWKSIYFISQLRLTGSRPCSLRLSPC